LDRRSFVLVGGPGYAANIAELPELLRKP